MTERDFCYWLQGAFELGIFDDGMSVEQARIIKNHLNLVFVHSLDGPDPTGKLQATHDGKKLLTEDDDKKELEGKIEKSKWPSKHPLARC